MAAPHYVGDDILISFVVLESGQAIVPSSATVVVYNPKGKVVKEDNARIDNNEVSYIIPSEVTNIEGTYRAIFSVILPGEVERTHPVETNVQPLPGGGGLNNDETLDITNAGGWLGKFKKTIKGAKGNWKEVLYSLIQKGKVV